jgi:hypothetical protein
MGGGSKSTSVTIPKWLEDAAKNSLSRAEEVSRTGYVPYYGPDVAAMTPMQVAAMQGTNTAASAFGMPTADPMAGMPTAKDYGGMSAYSSGDMYDQALAELERRMPGQFAALRAPFIDPVTGAQPGSPYGSGYAMGGAGGSASASAPAVSVATPSAGGAGRDDYRSPPSGGGRSTTSMATPGAYMPGGIYTRNPDSLVNRTAAAMSAPQGAPTAADRPVARPSTSGGGAGMGGKK